MTVKHSHTESGSSTVAQHLKHCIVHLPLAKVSVAVSVLASHPSMQINPVELNR